jgi:hypothetical protein
MDEQALIAKIKELKNIQPSKESLDFCRGKILAEMAKNSHLGAEKSFAAAIIDFAQIFRYPVAAALSIIVFLSGIGFTAAKVAQNSLPGDNLYPVKIVVETAHLTITTDNTEKARLESVMTYKRAQELAQIVRKNEGVENENVRQALDRVEKQLATATENLPKLIEINKREEVEISKAVEIAKEIKKNTEEAQKALSEARESISENISEKEAVAVKISDISEKAKETHNQISEIIENYENIINNDEADKIDKNESATSTPPENDK